MKKILSFILVTTVIVSFMPTIYATNTINAPEDRFGMGRTYDSRQPLNPELTPRPAAAGTVNKKFLSDAEYLVETLEISHPIFELPNLLDKDYEQIRDEFIDYASFAMNRTEFIIEILRYLRVFRDSHMTQIAWWWGYLGELYANINWSYRDNELYLADGRRVLEIAGLPVTSVFDMIDSFIYYENETDRREFYEDMSRNKVVLELAGAPIRNSITITVEDESIRANYRRGWDTPGKFCPHSDKNIIRHEMIGDVFYIDFRKVEFDEPAHNQTLTAIEKAISDGTRNFIFDLRCNGGGNSWAGEVLLNAIGLTIPQHGFYYRISPLSRIKWPESNATDGKLIKGWIPNVSKAFNKNNVAIAVLINSRTGSSAKMMTFWIQDGGFGIVVGEPSSNAPTAFGNIVEFKLPSTNIDMLISTTLIMRPDNNADQATIWPDIPIDHHQALEAALEYFDTRDNPTGIYASAEVARAARAEAAGSEPREIADILYGIIEIEDEMFYNSTLLHGMLTLPDTVISIGDRAFAGCSSLLIIVIPESVISIGKDAFLGTSPQLFINAPAGSYAEYYAQENNINFFPIGNAKTPYVPVDESSIPEQQVVIGNEPVSVPEINDPSPQQLQPSNPVNSGLMIIIITGAVIFAVAICFMIIKKRKIQP